MSTPWKSVFDLPAGGRAMIEANAGTGKTYTIAALYIKLIIEKNLTPGELLVMTFTRKATAELRERIFSRLKEALALFEGGSWNREDSFLNDLNRHVENREEAAQIVSRAIQDFDDHQVTTIHGFCQKVLKEETLLAGSVFDFEVEREDTRLESATEQFWREFIFRHQGSDAGISYVNKLLRIAKTPAQLQVVLEPLFSKPYAFIEAERMSEPLLWLEKLIGLRQQMRVVWGESREELMEIFSNSPVSRYTTHLKSRVGKLEAFLEDESYKDDTFTQLKYFTSDYLYDPDNYLKAKKQELHPRHRFFDLCSTYQELAEEAGKIEGTLIYEAYSEINELLDKSSSYSDSISYDDLLKILYNALTHGSQAQQLSAKLRRSYPVALVDEFQDTDPLQYTILDKIYVRNPGSEEVLYMIGDPKQAIYGFRGGDVYTYFQARQSLAGPVYSLEKNYRSADTLIQAVNTLFGREEGLFHEDEIRFFHSEKGQAPHQKEFTIDGEPAEEFRFLISGDFEKNKATSKELFFDYTARRTRHLLDLSEQGRVKIGSRRLEAGDIAILVSSHRDANTVRKNLKLLGVDSVVYSKQNVYTTFEAVRLRVVMEAILHPLSRKHRNRALLTGFFGFRISDLYGMKEDEHKTQMFIGQLLDMRTIWETKGLYFMFRKLLFEHDALVHLSALNDSERVLANLSHLAEMLSSEEQAEGLNPPELFRRFVREIRTARQDEEKALLLESDRNLVVISTIHNSKGLQYPVVFCPSLWEGPRKPPSLLEYHSEEELRLHINLDQYKSELRLDAEQKQEQEAIGEEIRKAYVAITRAEHYCEVMWTSHTDAWKSGIGLPFLGKERYADLQSGRAKVKDDLEGMAHAAIHELVSIPGSTLVKKRFDEELASLQLATDFTPVRSDKEEYAFEPYRGRADIRVQTNVESFTSLARQGADHPYEPDYDQMMDHYAAAFQEDTADGPDTIFTFPKGATPGTAIHKFFELDHFLFSEAADRDYTEEIETILQAFGMEISWAPVFQKMVRDVSGSAIPGLELGAIGKKDQLKEMEFLFKTGSVSYAALMKIIRSGAAGGGLVQGAVPFPDGSARREADSLGNALDGSASASGAGGEAERDETAWRERDSSWSGGDSHQHELDNAGRELDSSEREGDSSWSGGDSHQHELDTAGREGDSSWSGGDSHQHEMDSAGRELDSSGREGDSSWSGGDSHQREMDSAEREGDSRQKRRDGEGFHRLNQLMTGFIDLIVRQNNRFYIIDYKSNYLGDSPEDYSQESLKEEILRSDYDLQYHIYVVALVKYLRERMPGFRYEDHFGGVAYLFIRGMEAGSDRGIWFHKPKEEVIRELELRIED